MIKFDQKQMFILHRVIPMSSDVGYMRRKGIRFIVGTNPAMKNKRSARMPTRAVRKMFPLSLQDKDKGNPHAGRKTRERVLNKNIKKLYIVVLK